MNRKKLLFGCAMISGLATIACMQTHVRAQEGVPAGPESTDATSPAEKSVLTEGSLAANETKHPAQDFCQCVGDAESPAVERIERALRSPLHSTGIDFSETRLQAVVGALQEDYGIPIQLDTTALDEIGISTDEPVTINLNNISLRSALRLMLKHLQLTYIIQDEVLIITTPEQAESNLKTCVYDVGILAGERDSQIDAVIDTILSCVATETWAKNGGGEAEIRAIKPGLLVISQTQPVHEEIHNLLSAIRKMRESHGHAGHSAAAIVPQSADEVVTRSYRLQLNPTNDIDTMRGQVRDLIVGALPEEAWTGRLADGQAVTLTVFHDRIVVRQTPAVQEKLQRILADSGVATPSVAVAGSVSVGGGGGFFSPEMEGRSGAPGFGEGVPPGTAAPGFGGEGIAPEPARSE